MMGVLVLGHAVAWLSLHPKLMAFHEGLLDLEEAQSELNILRERDSVQFHEEIGAGRGRIVKETIIAPSYELNVEVAKRTSMAQKKWNPDVTITRHWHNYFPFFIASFAFVIGDAITVLTALRYYWS